MKNSFACKRDVFPYHLTGMDLKTKRETQTRTLNNYYSDAIEKATKRQEMINSRKTFRAIWGHFHIFWHSTNGRNYSTCQVDSHWTKQELTNILERLSIQRLHLFLLISLAVDKSTTQTDWIDCVFNVSDRFSIVTLALDATTYKRTG